MAKGLDCNSNTQDNVKLNQYQGERTLAPQFYGR